MAGSESKRRHHQGPHRQGAWFLVAHVRPSLSTRRHQHMPPLSALASASSGVASGVLLVCPPAGGNFWSQKGNTGPYKIYE